MSPLRTRQSATDACRNSFHSFSERQLRKSMPQKPSTAEDVRRTAFAAQVPVIDHVVVVAVVIHVDQANGSVVRRSRRAAMLGAKLRRVPTKTLDTSG